MRRRNNGACKIGQKHGQAIRHHDGASDARVRGQTGVCLLTMGRHRVNLQHLRAMHLRKKNRRNTHRLLKNAPIQFNLGRIIAYMVSQVE